MAPFALFPSTCGYFPFLYSFCAELCVPQRACEWRGLRDAPASWRRSLLQLFQWLQAAGSQYAHLSERHHALLEWEGASMCG